MIERTANVFLFSLLALLPASSVHSAAQKDEAAAQELLTLGEEKAAKGQYDQARSRYEKVVKKHPGTAAAKTAARRLEPNALLGWADLARTGPSSNRVDVVIMGDGYELKSLKKLFHGRADDIAEAVGEERALEEYLPYFNFIRAAVVSADNGIDGFGRDYDTALGSYLTSDTQNGFAAVKINEVMGYLDQLPEHDGFAFVVVNAGPQALPTGPVATIGGGLFIQEDVIHAFGHAFAGLGDEYVEANDRHVFTPGARPNVSLSETKVPWQHWIDEKHPSVGVYEGAASQVRGAFRPVGGNCVMELGRDFCPVCRETVVLAIYALVDPIDAESPDAQELGSKDSITPERIATSDSRYEALEFSVTPMKPKSHSLEVSWWVLPEHRAPKSRGVRLDPATRRARGELPPIDLEPVHTQRSARSGVYEFELDPKELEPGRYRVVCRVRDTTEVRGEKYPWVLSDPQGLLESERGWWVTIPAQ